MQQFMVDHGQSDDDLQRDGDFVKRAYVKEPGVMLLMTTEEVSSKGDEARIMGCHSHDDSSGTATYTYCRVRSINEQRV
jgi:hypothetical protein